MHQGYTVLGEQDLAGREEMKAKCLDIESRFGANVSMICKAPLTDHEEQKI